MRAVKAKQLRRQARGTPGEKTYYYSNHTSPRILHPDSWRGDYQRLKKAA